jgi:hypothetical protein
MNYRDHKNKSPEPESSGEQILLERQGTMWEGSGKKELPEWMTQAEEETSELIVVRPNIWVRMGRLLTAIFR